jgi:integrating conjugative element relaxase (TIGR03760 family)
MFSLFRRKPPLAAVPEPTEVAALEKAKGLTRPESAASLLAAPRRRKLLDTIWQHTSLSRAQFALLYQHPLERTAELAQAFPASENHHHAYPGGLLDHGLETVACALKLRQSRLLPTGVTPEEQAAQSDAWTAAVAYAALLHDLGKLAVDLHVELADGTLWHPWHGPIALPYRFRYRKEREYRLHGAAAGLLYCRILTPDILDWLSSYPAPWSALLYVLAGQYEHAGALGELVIQADQASVAQALGGDPARAMAAPKHSLPRKLLDGLRYLLKEELKLNQPQASDGWLTQETLWLVSKTVSDRLRAHLLSQGIEGIPASTSSPGCASGSPVTCSSSTTRKPWCTRWPIPLISSVRAFSSAMRRSIRSSGRWPKRTGCLPGNGYQSASRNSPCTASKTTASTSGTAKSPGRGRRTGCMAIC